MGKKVCRPDGGFLTLQGLSNRVRLMAWLCLCGGAYIVGLGGAGVQTAFAQSGASKQTASETQNKNAGSLTGILRGPNGIPLPGATVVVLSEDGERVLGVSETFGGKRGPDLGRWSVEGLPDSGNVIVVAFHPQLPDALAEVRVQMKAEKQPVYGLEIRPLVSDSSPALDPADGTRLRGSGFLGLLLTIGREWNTKQLNEMARASTERLSKEADEFFKNIENERAGHQQDLVRQDPSTYESAREEAAARNLEAIAGLISAGANIYSDYRAKREEKRAKKERERALSAMNQATGMGISQAQVTCPECGRAWGVMSGFKVKLENDLTRYRQFRPATPADQAALSRATTATQSTLNSVNQWLSTNSHLAK